MAFRQHPAIELLVNEDGTILIYNGKRLEVSEYKPDSKNYLARYVRFMSRQFTVAKLVCEAWNGLREEMDQVVCRRDKDPGNDHYTNLYWGKRGKILTCRTARDHRSAVKKNEIPQVIERLGNGETLRNIARSYNTSDMSIHRIKRRWMLDRTLMLKEAVMNANTPHDRQLAYAKYMGYKTVTDAIDAYGRHKFKQTIENLSMTI